MTSMRSLALILLSEGFKNDKLYDFKYPICQKRDPMDVNMHFIKVCLHACFLRVYPWITKGLRLDGAAIPKISKRHFFQDI